MDPTRDAARLLRALHACPEPSGHEEATAGTLADWLTDCGLDVQRGVAGHGLLVRLGDPPYRLLRAELDAVPAAGGLGHHCGHDGHMAMLAGALAGWAQGGAPRGVAALFQPAEETGEGMAWCLDDPALRDLDVADCYALHNVPGEPIGTVLLTPGALASRGLRIRLRGRSSHAAAPSDGVSPWPLARDVADRVRDHEAGDPRATLVHIRLGDEAYGTSPGAAVVAATLRGTRDESLDALEDQLVPAAAHGVRVERERVDPFPATRNDPAALDRVEAAAGDAGLATARRADPWPWSEDFGHATARWPGALVGLGAGQDAPVLHDAAYRFPADLLPHGIQLWRAIGGMA